MNKYFISLLIISVCLLCSCNYRTDQQNEKILTSVVLMMDSKPDSAYLLLNTINVKELNELLYYRFIVLKVNVKDKLYMNATEDTVVFRAMNYFLENNNVEYKLLSCFVSAKVYEELNNQEKAMEYYLEAIRWIDRNSNFLLNGTIYHNLSRLFSLKNQYHHSITYAENARKYYDLANCDYGKKIRLKELFAYNYLYLNEVDSSIFYHNIALNIAIRHHDIQYQKSILQSLAVSYRTAKEFKAAKEKCKQALSLTKTTDSLSIGRLQLTLGGVLFEEKQYDSASICLYNAKRLIKHTDDINDYIDLNRLLGEVAAKNKNYEQALNYKELSDSHLLARKSFEVASQVMLAKHQENNFKALQAERDKHVEERLYLYTALIILSLIIISGALFYKGKMNFRKLKGMFCTVKEKYDKAIEEHNKTIEEYDQKLEKSEKEKAQIEMRLEDKLSAVNKVAKNQLLKVIFQIKDIARLRALSDARYVDNKAVSRQVNKIISQITFADAYLAYNNAFDGLFDKLEADLSFLDEREYQICALSCVGLGTLVIAAILDEMPNSVQKWKTIIRKKIGIGSYGSFQEYVYNKYGIEIIEDPEED